MTIGYASFNEELNLQANIELINELNADTIVLETKYKYVNTLRKNSVIISLSIEDEKDNSTSIKVINNSDEMLTYAGNKAVYDGDIYPNVTGILPGDYLLPNEERIIYLKNLNDNPLGNILIDFEFIQNAVKVLKPIIITNVLNPIIDLNNNKGTIEIDVLNQYDSSIELEFYLNDDDLDIDLEKNIFTLDKGESKKFILNIESNIVPESDIRTILYARVLSNTSSDDIYVLENITIKKDV